MRDHSAFRTGRLFDNTRKKVETMFMVLLTISWVIYQIDNKIILKIVIPNAEKALAQARAPAVWEERRVQPHVVKEKEKHLQYMEDVHLALFLFFWLAFLLSIVEFFNEVGLGGVIVEFIRSHI